MTESHPTSGANNRVRVRAGARHYVSAVAAPLQSRLRDRSLLELVFADAKVKLRAGQSKPTCRVRLVPAAVAQDFDNRGAFDDPQIRRICALLALDSKRRVTTNTMRIQARGNELA